MIISPFTPLFFYPAGKKPQSDGVDSPYIQTFARTDKILIECFVGATDTNPVLSLINLDGGTTNLSLNIWTMYDGSVLHFTTLSGLSPGIYKIYIPNYNIYSYEFRVSDDQAELRRTTLIQYSMKDNKRRTDGVWLINGMRHFFDFRVPGGFKDSDISFGCESEQFTTQHGDICSLYALDSTQRKFTLGGQEGVPARFAELLNRLLCCTYVYFDGVRYARKDASVPEINIQIDGIDSFVFKQTLQKVTYLNPDIENANLAILRRVDPNYYRTTEINDTTYNRLIK